jgi:hypothetical protein
MAITLNEQTTLGSRQVAQRGGQGNKAAAAERGRWGRVMWFALCGWFRDLSLEVGEHGKSVS